MVQWKARQIFIEFTLSGLQEKFTQIPDADELAAFYQLGKFLFCTMALLMVYFQYIGCKPLVNALRKNVNV